MKQMRRPSGDSCGCAMGARFLAAAMMASVAWYAAHWHSSGLTTAAMLLRVTLLSFAAAAIGKIYGIVRAHVPLTVVSARRTPQSSAGNDVRRTGSRD
jgi:hypothetical protein